MPAHDPLAARVQRLEEAHGFAERTIEELSAEIALLNRHLAEAQARIGRLEARLQSALEPPEPSPGE